MIIFRATFILRVPFGPGPAVLICLYIADCHAFIHAMLFTLFLCYLQERFQVKNPPHTYIQKLKGYLDPAVTRKVSGVYFHFLLPLPHERAESSVLEETFLPLHRSLCQGLQENNLWR